MSPGSTDTAISNGADIGIKFILHTAAVILSPWSREKDLSC